MSTVDFAFASMLAVLSQCARPGSRVQVRRDGRRVFFDVTTTRERPPFIREVRGLPPSTLMRLSRRVHRRTPRRVGPRGSTHIYTARPHAHLPSPSPVWPTSSPRASLAVVAACTPLQPLQRADDLLPHYCAGCRRPRVARCRAWHGAAWVAAWRLDERRAFRSHDGLCVSCVGVWVPCGAIWGPECRVYCLTQLTVWPCLVVCICIE